MKRYFLTAAVILLYSSFTKGDSLFVSPSVYSTYGDYNNKDLSRAYSFYNTLQLSEKNFLINEYEQLKIEDHYFSYKQQSFLLGTYSVHFPWYIKFNYAYLKGDYNYKQAYYKYSDYTNIYNADISSFYDWYYLGASVTYLHLAGYKEQAVGQITLRIEKVLSPEIYLSLKPNYSTLLDGRKLWSVALKSHFLLTPSLLLKAGGFIGERAYYLDPDLLTIFNQDYTQYNQLFVQAEYNFTPALKTMLSYQYTTFSQYRINYFMAGIKYWFYL